MIGVDLQRAANALIRGELVAIPTETVYGLAANALDKNAVLKIFEAKNRPSFDPLIVHVPNVEVARSLVRSFPPLAEKLATAFWPGALTLILPKKDIIPDEVTSGLDFVGIRIPNHVLALELLNTIDFPLAAPSANPFSYVSPTSAQHVENQLGSRISYILDGGPCTVGIESTIVSFEHPESPTILRFGGLSQEDIEACIGKVKIQVSANSNPKAPGQLDKHYATTKPTRIVEVLPESADAFVISFGEDAGRGDFNLSATGNLIEAARNLFAALRLADESHHISIVAQLVLNQGLGRAINDRLKRAAVV